MAKFTAIVLAAAALIAGAQAACPANGFFCGSELLNVYKCATLQELQYITPPNDVINTMIYPTNNAGQPVIPSGSCVNTGCRNSDLTLSPPRYATCF